MTSKKKNQGPFRHLWGDGKLTTILGVGIGIIANSGALTPYPVAQQLATALAGFLIANKDPKPVDPPTYDPEK
jgi:hypothetical protein